MTNIIPIKTQNVSSSKWDYFWHIFSIKMAVTWCVSRLGYSQYIQYSYSWCNHHISKKKRTKISQRRSTQCHAETADDDTMAGSDMALKYLLTISAILYHGHGTGWIFFEISFLVLFFLLI